MSNYFYFGSNDKYLNLSLVAVARFERKVWNRGTETEHVDYSLHLSYCDGECGEFSISIKEGEALKKRLNALCK